MSTSKARETLGLAAQAKQAGRAPEARRLLEDLLAAEPACAAAWNSLGLMQLEAGEADGAAASLAKAVEHDPRPPLLWYNLARARGAAGDVEGELATLDQALARDPYFLPALLAKGKALERSARSDEAVQLYRAFLAGIRDDGGFPPQIRTQLAAAREAVRADAERQHRLFAQALEDVAAAFPDADLTRASGYAEQRAGRGLLDPHGSTVGHFPGLPAIEFFAREHFPWFEALEAKTDAIRRDLLSLWTEEDRNFRPYVEYDPTTPVNQWAELNHSPRWSAWFLWENGVRNEAHCARCPATAAALAEVPLLDIPGKAPSVMFSGLRRGCRPAARRLDQRAHHGPPAAGGAGRMRLPGRNRDAAVAGGRSLGVRRYGRARGLERQRAPARDPHPRPVESAAQRGRARGGAGGRLSRPTSAGA